MDPILGLRSALNDNMGLGSRVRDRRQELVNTRAIHPIEAAQSAYSGGLGMDALFGALQERGESAFDAGQRYGVNWRGFGRAGV